MDNNDPKIEKQMKGIPIEALIGGPLQAACKANIMLAKSTAEFIEKVGFELDQDGKPNDKIRMANFVYEKPNQKDNGDYTIDKVHVDIPLISIVPIPNLQIDTINILFDMEVAFSSIEKEETETDSEFDPLKEKVKIHGKISSHKDNTRKSDFGAKYHFDIHASNAGIPEGLARVMDLFAQAVVPKKIVQEPNNNLQQEDK